MWLKLVQTHSCAVADSFHRRRSRLVLPWPSRPSPHQLLCPRRGTRLASAAAFQSTTACSWSTESPQYLLPASVRTLTPTGSSWTPLSKLSSRRARTSRMPRAATEADTPPGLLLQPLRRPHRGLQLRPPQQPQCRGGQRGCPTGTTSPWGTEEQEVSGSRRRRTGANMANS